MKKKQVFRNFASAKWKRIFGIWMTLVVVLSVVAQAAGLKYAGHFFRSSEFADNQNIWQYGASEMQLLPVAVIQATEQYITRETSGQKPAEFLEGQTCRRLRYVQQYRHGINIVANTFSACPRLFGQYFSLGSREQKELLSRSRLIVEFICRADGKKDGIISLIK